MDVELKQIITQIIAFLIMLWILKRYAWKPLLKLLDERSEKIANEFKAIDAKNEEVEKLKQLYHEKIQNIKNEGDGIIRNSVRKAQKASHDLQIEAQKKALEMIKKAQEEIDRERIKSEDNIKNTIVDLTFATFEKLTHLKMDAKEREKYTATLIEEM